MRTLIDWILATRLSQLVLTHGWVWPASEALHFTGLLLMVGALGMFDLRVLGVAKGIPPAAIHRLIPLAMTGFAISLATGLLFISGAPDQYFFNSAFHLKLVFLLLMGLNAVFFYAAPFRSVMALDASGDASRVAKVSAAVSLIALVGVMCCGRMLTFFRPPGYF